jgi:hypothetical protein
VNSDPEAAAARLRAGVLLLIMVLAVAGAATGFLDHAGEAYAESALKRALIAFGLARTVNGVISVAQGTEVSIEPAGIGVTLAPGEILDPINDLVERFSWVVLAAATSLGVQRVLLEVASWLPLSIALALALGAAALCASRTALSGTRAARIVYASAALLFVLRFAAPLAAVAVSGLYHAFLEPRYSTASTGLESSASSLRAINADSEGGAEDESATDAPRTMLDRARRAYEAAGNALDVRRRIDALTDAAARLTDQTIDLIVVFTIETLLLPLLFLWVLLAVLRRVLAAALSP